MDLTGFRTIIAAVIGGTVTPWLSKHVGLTLSPDQQLQLVAATMGVVMIVARWFTKTPIGKSTAAPAATASTTTVAKVIPLLLLAGAMLASGSMLSGCATDGKLITPTVVTIEQGVADVAVATAVSKGIPAAQIKAIAQQLLALDNGATALATIEAVIGQKLVALKLPPGDLAAAQLLTQSLTAAVQAKLSTGTAGSVNANTQVAIADVLNAVIQACSFYAA